MKVIRKAGRRRRRDDVHEAIEQREPFSWLGVDGQPVPLESDEQVLALIQAHGGQRQESGLRDDVRIRRCRRGRCSQALRPTTKACARAAAQGRRRAASGLGPWRRNCSIPRGRRREKLDCSRPSPASWPACQYQTALEAISTLYGAPRLDQRKSWAPPRGRRASRSSSAKKGARPSSRPTRTRTHRPSRRSSTRAENNGERGQEGGVLERRRLRLEKVGRRGRGLGRADAAQRWRENGEAAVSEEPTRPSAGAIWRPSRPINYAKEHKGINQESRKGTGQRAPVQEAPKKGPGIFG